LTLFIWNDHTAHRVSCDVDTI